MAKGNACSAENGHVGNGLEIKVCPRMNSTLHKTSMGCSHNHRDCSMFGISELKAGIFGIHLNSLIQSIILISTKVLLLYV